MFDIVLLLDTLQEFEKYIKFAILKYNHARQPIKTRPKPWNNTRKEKLLKLSSSIEIEINKRFLKAYN